MEVRAERLDWLPPVLASLDLPFATEQPDELRSLVIAFADKLRASAMTGGPAARHPRPALWQRPVRSLGATTGQPV